MSKVQLRKELKLLTKPQLEELILDLYEARKEAKEYLDFFVNPDVESMFGKYVEAVNKELRKSKWGESKARVNHLKKLLKDLMGFKLDARTNIRAMGIILGGLMSTERYYNMGNPLMNMMYKLVDDMVEYADKNMEFEYALDELTRLFDLNIGIPRRVADLRRRVEEVRGTL